jgi:hypothetical protein
VNIPTNRINSRIGRRQIWYSGKHKRHGGAITTVAAPDGELLWVSGVLPGRTVDITAARRFKIAEKILDYLGLLADLGYVGLHPDAIVGRRKPRGKPMPRATREANRLRAQLPCVGERGNAQLKAWKVLANDFREARGESPGSSKPCSPCTTGSARRSPQPNRDHGIGP